MKASLPFLVALAVRLLFVFLEPQTQLVGDERTWVAWGIEQVERNGFSPFRHAMIFHAPLYPHFVAALHALFGSLLAVQLAQCVVSALLVPAVARVAERLFDARAGLVAAWITALFPDLVWYAAHFWVETLFLTLLWWAIERTMAAEDRMPLMALGAGALFGLAALTRETALYFIPVAALWLARGAAVGRRRAAALLLGGFVVIAPWTWRNWVVFHAFVPVSTQGGMNLWIGNARLPRDEVYEKTDAVQGRIEQFRYATRMGLAEIRRRQPLWLPEKIASEMPQLFEVESLPLIHVQRGAYGAASPLAARLAAVVVVLPYLLLLAAAVIGFAAWPARRGAGLLLLFLVYVLALHVITYGFSRFRMPLVPLIVVAASGAAAAAWERRPLFGRPSARLVALVLGAALAATLVPSLVRLWHEPVYRGEAPLPAPRR